MQAAEEEEEFVGLYQGAEECLSQLGAVVAAAVLTRRRLPEESAATFQSLLPGVCACSLAVQSEERESLRLVALVERGGMCRGELAPGDSVRRETVAWQAFREKRTLVWTRSSGSAAFQDWRDILKVHATASALVTAPLLYCNDQAAMGSATFALNAEPGPWEVSLLEGFARGIGQHISHQIKHLWELSLGFLNEAVPRRILQRMLSAAAAAGMPAPLEPRMPEPQSNGGRARRLHMVSSPAASAEGPLVQEPEPEQAAASEPEGPQEAAGKGSVPLTAEQQRTFEAALPLFCTTKAFSPAEGTPGRPRVGRLDSATKHWVAAGIGGSSSGSGGGSDGFIERCSAPGTPLSVEPAPASPLHFILQDISLEAVPQQKWNLEFSDPALEEGYKLWFNTRQADTDSLVFRSYLVMLLVVAGGLLLRGSLATGSLLLCCQVLASVAVPVYLLAWHREWYVRTRSLVVAGARTSAATIILMHAYLHPELYNGSLLKALCGNCVLSMALGTFRNRLRFSNHLMSQLFKLYLSTTCNAFIYSDPARAGRVYLTLGQSTLSQLAGILLPTIALYRMEARARRAFVLRQAQGI